jgi:hypothetical protein
MRSSTEVARRLTVQTEKKLNDGDNPFSTELRHAEGAGGAAVVEKSVADGGMRANRNSPQSRPTRASLGSFANISLVMAELAK